MSTQHPADGEGGEKSRYGDYYADGGHDVGLVLFELLDYGGVGHCGFVFS